MTRINSHNYPVERKKSLKEFRKAGQRINPVNQRRVLISITIRINLEKLDVFLFQIQILNHILTQNAFRLRNGPLRRCCFDIVDLCRAH